MAPVGSPEFADLLVEPLPCFISVHVRLAQTHYKLRMSRSYAEGETALLGLHVELWIDIFERTTDDLVGLTTLALVSRIWKSIVLRTPVLWNTVRVGVAGYTDVGRCAHPIV